MATGSASPRKVDRYGCYQTDIVLSEKEAAEQAQDAEKESSRTAKWMRMISQDWSNLKGSAFSTVARRVKKGIPDGIRSLAWQKILDMKSWQAKTTAFASLKDLERMEPYRTIDVDLSRTFPQMSFYSNPAIVESLRHVLYAYCHCDPEVGYCQGMSFIAGMFTAYMDEESSFYCFVSVMQNETLAQRGYFLPDFPKLKVTSAMFELLLEKYLPAVKRHIDSIGIVYQMYTPPWFNCAFLSFDWAPELQFRIFERFLFYGTRFLLAFALAFMKSQEKLLSTGEMEDLLPCLQRPYESPLFKDWHDVLHNWEKYWIRKKEYAELVAKTAQ
jgi:hypothetical protein